MSMEESKASVESKAEDVRREQTSVRDVDEKHPVGVYEMENGSLIDIYSYHEQRAGSLVVDPEEAKIEFGEAVASRLKLTRDGRTVLWPQPTDDPEDPLNWTTRRKTLQMIIITLAAIVPDFQSAAGIPALFPLAAQFGTTTGEINNLTSNWSIFLLGWGSLFAVMLMRRYGRLPILFWSQVFGLGFNIGATFAPNLAVFAGMRCLNGFFATAPQVTGLYVVTDMYPFHLQARMLNIWTMGFIISPFLSPFLFGFLIANASWRWAYGIASIYGALVLGLIAFFGQETMYDRTIKPIPVRPAPSLRYRVETLLGITGVRMAKYRMRLADAFLEPIKLFWRPQILGILIFEAALFGFSIGINVTLIVFLGTPTVAGGFGWSQIAIAGGYATPMIAVLLGEIFGRYVNDWIATTSIRRNHGVFEPETRLWACYIAIPLNICGFVVLGASLQNHLSAGGLIMGWGIAEFSVMIGTVSVYAYMNDCFPRNRGEVSALVNLARTLGGFAVPFFQLPWAMEHGALQSFGCEAAITAGLFLLFVPLTQYKGRELRRRFAM
ncbi:MFS general substrate transporter [Peniophora sp. CONT]|nr:MFS general substrate transporter [Peniophora sp. CONT]